MFRKYRRSNNFYLYSVDTHCLRERDGEIINIQQVQIIVKGTYREQKRKMERERAKLVLGNGKVGDMVRRRKLIIFLDSMVAQQNLREPEIKAEEKECW